MMMMMMMMMNDDNSQVAGALTGNTRANDDVTRGD